MSARRRIVGIVCAKAPHDRVLAIRLLGSTQHVCSWCVEPVRVEEKCVR